MLMTLTRTQEPATDIGCLLRKNPAHPQSFNLSFGKAHVFYPEATPKRCTVAFLVEVDPVGQVRNRRGTSGEVITTPNREYNVKWETLPAGKFRHRDHRFEWTRPEFQEWAHRVAARFGYNVHLQPVGPEDSAVDAPTQDGSI